MATSDTKLKPATKRLLAEVTPRPQNHARYHPDIAKAVETLRSIGEGTDTDELAKAVLEARETNTAIQKSDGSTMDQRERITKAQHSLEREYLRKMGVPIDQIERRGGVHA